VLFALSCLLMGFYDVFSAGLYASQCVREGAVWQRAQFATLSLIGLAVVWFVHDYSYRRSKRTFFVFLFYFLASALLSVVGPRGLVLTDAPSIKVIEIPLLRPIVYYESVPGPLVMVQSVAGIAAFVYAFWIVSLGYRTQGRERYRPLAIAMAIFCAGVLNDVFVTAGVYSFLYLIEYSYMGMVMLMAFSLSRELDRATAEREHLKAIEQRFDAVFRNAAVGIGLLSTQKRFISANSALCGMLGRSSAELATQTLGDCVAPEDAPDLLQAADALVAGELDSLRSERRYRQPGGKTYWGDMSLAPVRSPAGAITAMLWIVVGITERRRATRELQRLNADLERQVARRTTELEGANLRLSKSLEVLRQDEEAGRMIQFNLLPAESVRIGSYRFDRYLAPSMYVSGDFVNYFDIDTRHAAFYMADVSGHGVSSAFITVLLHSLVNNSLANFEDKQDRTVLDPAGMLSVLNRELVRHGGGKHITIFYGVLDQELNSLTYANGGAFPLPILRHGGGIEQISSPGTAVGLFESSTFENVTRPLPDPFLLALFSDGILDLLQGESLAEKQAELEGLIDTVALELHSLVGRTGLAGMGSLPDDVAVLFVKGGRSS
jgi:PAS domain S-box-containing protein